MTDPIPTLIDMMEIIKEQYKSKKYKPIIARFTDKDHNAFCPVSVAVLSIYKEHSKRPQDLYETAVRLWGHSKVDGLIGGFDSRAKNYPTLRFEFDPDYNFYYGVGAGLYHKLLSNEIEILGD